MPHWPILHKNFWQRLSGFIPIAFTVYPEPYPQIVVGMTVRLPLLVSGLGVAQIISWGSLYYPISVLGESMQRDLGVTPTLLFAAFTVSLLISGMVAPAVGRLMEARGARLVLCMGSLLGMGALIIMAFATGPLSLFAGAVVAGIAMAACLYGIGNGLMTIVRGVVPAELYGRRDYGILLGKLARPAFVARALAPFAFPLLLAAAGPRMAVLALVAIAMASCWSYRIALLQARRG